MRVNLPGLIGPEKLPSGRDRWRVRVRGNKAKRITLPVGPDDPDFLRYYDAARRGEKIGQEKAPETIRRSLAWLVDGFCAHMEERVRANLLDVRTLNQRRMYYGRLREQHGDKHMAMPPHAVVEIRDSMAATPGAADNMVKALKALFKFGIERGLLKENPAAGVARINRGTGAVPWSIDDLAAFRARHPQGTMAHLALTLFVFTAARIEDVAKFGRHNEIVRGGATFLEWQPAKRGSNFVSIPILPPLERAISAQTIIGPTYLLSGHGKPFASKDALGNWFRDRVREAGLENRSPHGIRKAAGELLALQGASQYHIMAVHGHSSAQTSEVYTAKVNRARLAQEAMQKLAGLEW